MKTRERLEAVIDQIDLDEFSSYYFRRGYGEKIGVWDDGSLTVIGASEIIENDRLLITFRCPGIGNLDSTTITDGFVEEVEDDDGNITYRAIGGKTVYANLDEVIDAYLEVGDIGWWVDDWREQLLSLADEEDEERRLNPTDDDY